MKSFAKPPTRIRHEHIGALIFAAGLAVLAACTGGGGQADAGVPTGTLSVRFSVSSGVRESPNLHQPLRGPVYGAIFHTEDVSLTGPRDDAGEVAEVTVTDVDLTDPDGGLSAASWTSPPLPEAQYSFLGYFDVNRDAGGADPSPGDPVTLPTTNKTTVIPGREVPLKVEFNLVYN